jgi:N utilization substance protein B
MREQARALNTGMAESPKKPLSRRKARRKAFELLFELEQHPGVTIEDLLTRTFEENLFTSEDEEDGVIVGEFNKSNRDFVYSACRLVAGNMTTLDEILMKYPHEWRFDRIGAPERTILRMSLAELLYMDTPFKIAINEALDLTKLYGEAESNRFINGILGGVVRDLDTLKEQYAL